MKRELAFALEARSQIGWSRSSETSPAQVSDSRNKERSSSHRSGRSVDEVHVNRRSKRLKTDIPDGDLVNIDKSKGRDESEVAEVANGDDEAAEAEGEEKSAAEAAEEVVTDGEEAAAAELVNGVEKSAAVNVVTGGEEAAEVAEKVYVKRKKSKKRVRSSTPRRFTRSVLKEKDENVEELGTSSRKKLELKMSNKIELDRMPTNMRGLLETGLLEGFRVCYKFDSEEKNLQGVIKGVGILCSCELCGSTKVIAPSKFELHACKSYRHAIRFIFLENGKSLLELIEICKASASEPLEVALQTVISSLPAKGPSVCTICNSSFGSSSPENLLICDSCLIKRNEVDAEPAVSTFREVRTSTPEPKASEGNLLSFSSDRKPKRGRKRKSSKSAVKPTKSAENYISSRGKTKLKKHKRSLRSASVPRPVKSVTNRTSPQQSSRKKLTIKSQRLHWPVFQKGGLPDGTELTYIAQGKKLLDGYKRGKGIFCSCCKTEISASQFEAHAGWAARKKPYENIYISNGVSLHEYAVSMKMNKKEDVQ